MGSIGYTALFAAEASRWDSLRSGIRAGFKNREVVDPTEMALSLAMLLAVPVAIWLVFHLVARHKRRPYRPRRPRPRLLFFSLCRAHRLSWWESWWLWQLARAQHVAEPARVFLEPERFQPAHLPPPLWPHAALLARLRDRLFAGLQGAPGEQPPKPLPLKALSQ
jgi:hypothetical protein